LTLLKHVSQEGQIVMNAIEQGIVDYLKRRHAEGALSATAAELMAAVIPADQPELRFKPSYKYAIQRLRVRSELNACTAADGTTHYFIGAFPTPELRASLGHKINPLI
jgi:hypothetical protein